MNFIVFSDPCSRLHHHDERDPGKKTRPAPAATLDGMIRKRAIEPPARKPHPDPRIEAELQRIISLRKTVARKEELLAGDHLQITRMRERLSRRPTWDAATPVRQQIDGLLAETQTLEREVTQLHDDIAGRIAKLDDTDLAWLEDET
jgi:hypothetical protein